MILSVATYQLRNHFNIHLLVGLTFCVNTYIAEISTPNHRGPLLGTLLVAFNVGLFLCTVLMYNITWKSTALVFLIISIICLLLILRLPESPIWLYSKGRQEEAIDTLCRIRCETKDIIDFEIREIERLCQKQQQTKRSICTSVKECRKGWKSFIIANILHTLLQTTGYSILIAFTPMILERLKIPFNAAGVTVVYTTVGFIGSMFIPVFTSRINRKTLLSYSSFGMGTCMFIVVIYEEMFYHKDEKPCAWIIPFVLYLYVLICNMCMLPICFIIPGEIFPQEVRGFMNGLYGVVCYTYWVILLKVYPEIMFKFGVKIMIWAFCSACFLLCLFSVFIVPETRGKTLNEIQNQYFRKKRNMSDFNNL